MQNFPVRITPVRITLKFALRNGYAWINGFKKKKTLIYRDYAQWVFSILSTISKKFSRFVFSVLDSRLVLTVSVSSRLSGRRPRNLGLIDCKQIRTAKQTLTITTLHQKKDLNKGRPVFCKGLGSGYINVDLYKVIHSLCVSRQAPRWLLSAVDYALSLHHSLISRTVASRLRCTYEPTHLVCVCDGGGQRLSGVHDNADTSTAYSTGLWGWGGS